MTESRSSERRCARCDQPLPPYRSGRPMRYHPDCYQLTKSENRQRVLRSLYSNNYDVGPARRLEDLPAAMRSLRARLYARAAFGERPSIHCVMGAFLYAYDGERLTIASLG